MGREDVNVVLRARDQFTGPVGGLGAAIKKLALTAGAYFGAREIVRFGKDAVRSFVEQERATMKLAAALKATGGAIGLNLKQLQDYADALQTATVYGDEEIETAMSILATFKNIQGPAFQRTTALVLDMSYALGQDLKSSVIQLGKALNDPVRGVSALQRVGVSFTEEQKEMIKSLIETKDQAGAMRIIMDEVAAQFGGQAVAATQTLGGQLTQLSNAWGDAKEGIGKYLIEQANAAEWTTGFRIALQNLGDTSKLVWLTMRLQVVEFVDKTKAAFADWAKMIPALYLDTITGGLQTIYAALANIWKFIRATINWAKTGEWNFGEITKPYMATRRALGEAFANMPESPAAAALREEIAALQNQITNRELGKINLAGNIAAGVVSGVMPGAGPGGGPGMATATARRGARFRESRTLTGVSLMMGPAERATVENARTTRQILERINELTGQLLPRNDPQKSGWASLIAGRQL